MQYVEEKLTPEKSCPRYGERIDLEQSVNLAGVDIDIDIEIAWCSGKSWDGLDVGGEGVPIQ
jgi:hypothetical protein